MTWKSEGTVRASLKMKGVGYHLVRQKCIKHQEFVNTYNELFADIVSTFK